MKVANINQNKLISSNKNVQNKQQAFGGKGIVADAVFKSGVKVAPLGMIPDPLHFANIACVKGTVDCFNSIQKLYEKIPEKMAKGVIAISNKLSKYI